ncbi:MAG: DinB family protein [Imperialibacter sp.]|uniref:DinB family protein n=1 Tax=Imperialibacter sp. TaxID=2038411 RepID=UPI0030D7ACC8|tara:strand:- start:374955 stop:375500 length:546 start_codon:yes stop_codon:yes gene_type:complete
MKKGILIATMVSAAAWCQAQHFNASMASVMKSMKAYTLEMVELMPEDGFDYKPADSVRSFSEQVQHMISTNHFLLNHYLIDKQKGSRQEAGAKAAKYAEKSGKAALSALLAEQFDQTIAFFERADASLYEQTFTFGPVDKPIVKDYFTTSTLIRDHFTHHRSQLIVYLRLKGIEPAQFRPF